jgi:hypothetical protein
MEKLCKSLNDHWTHLGKLVTDRVDRVSLLELLAILQEAYEGKLGKQSFIHDQLCDHFCSLISSCFVFSANWGACFRDVFQSSCSVRC